MRHRSFILSIQSILLIALLAGCNRQRVPVAYQYQRYDIVGLERDSTTDQIIRPYKNRIDSVSNRIIGTAAYDIFGGRPEGLLTNFVCDLMLKHANQVCKKHGIEKVDMAFCNLTGLRNPIPQGIINIGTIYKVMPFENKLTILKFEGLVFKKILDKIASEGGDGISGVQFGIKKNKAIEIRVGGKPFDIAKSYYIVTSDYLANGGSDMAVMKKSSSRIDLEILLRDAIILHIEQVTKSGKNLAPKIDGRIYVD